MWWICSNPQMDMQMHVVKETLEELVTALKNSHTAKVGIGLGNIYQRIQTMYQNGGLRIYSKKGRGTVNSDDNTAGRKYEYVPCINRR